MAEQQHSGIGLNGRFGKEITVGFGGAAGDGLDRAGSLLARTANRLGLYAISYNSYQSLIRGGYTYLRLRLAEKKVHCVGDHMHILIALNQDTIERHAGKVAAGGLVLYNSDKISCDQSFVSEGVHLVPLPVKEITKDMGKLLPIMQNTVAVGALLYFANLEIDAVEDVLTATFQHKGTSVVDLNIKIAQGGYDYARTHYAEFQDPGSWKFSRQAKPFFTGNHAIALGACAGGLKFYSAYPMSPASNILHWMAQHSAKCGVLVKQAEDEIAVISMAVGAGHTGVRAMCATSGGGFALMTEAIGLASMIEAPVVVVNVMRGGPSTGLPTKTEQGDLNQVFGASQGDYPRVIIAATSTTDCFHTAVEALNLAEKYQLPVIILSELLLGENPETIESEAWSQDVPIERGELVREVPPFQAENDGFKRYLFTPSGVSPRPVIGSEGMVHVAASDDHDEDGVIISDVFTCPPIRRKISEKRMRKVENLRKELPPPKLEGSDDADVTLIGWGSTWGTIHEAVGQLEDDGISTNHLHFKYLYPFHEQEARAILEKCRKTIVVEVNYSGQFTRHLRAETGFTVDDTILKYDGEPLEPRMITNRVREILQGKPLDLRVTEAEASEMAYHYIRVHLSDKARPKNIVQITQNGFGEPVWELELVDRKNGNQHGKLIIGVETGATHRWEPVA